ncbi:MAG TPA: hypothetical protein VG817_09490, partial [Gemmatimonadales bacterium]|nr:hypothetical protein [Gemmatimonadales bacterium]
MMTTIRAVALLLVPLALQAQDPGLPGWVTVDAPAKTVRLTLEVEHPAGDSLVTINGERQG